MLAPPWPSLRWTVQAMAQRRGIQDMEELAELAGLGERTVRSVWSSRRRTRQPSRSIAVSTLQRLCLALDARPPGCFAWADEANAQVIATQAEQPYLVWRVARLAQARGIETPTAFGQRAHIFYSTRSDSKPMPAERLWSGRHEFVSLPVLARVLVVTRTEPGDLLAWDKGVL